jgi:hypothetical protein
MADECAPALAGKGLSVSVNARAEYLHLSDC